MKNRILAIIKTLEIDYNIKVLFAVEQGSRTWGLSNEGSDYDVKFVYVHKFDKYLDMNKPKDYIEYSSTDKLVNLAGFDIYKFAGLLSKSNPSAIEVVRSPTVYYGNVPLAFKWLAENEYNPRSLVEHYRSLCKKNYLKYIKSGNDVRVKRYLCALRGAINALYISDRWDLPTSKFAQTLDESFINSDWVKFGDDTYKCIIKLMKEKINNVNTGEIENIKELDEWIEKIIEMKFDGVEKRYMNTDNINKEVKNIVYNQR